MTRVPTFPPLLGLPQAIEGVANIVAIAVWKRVTPGMSWREAKEHGDTAAFAQHKVLGVLSPGDMTPRFLETTDEEFQIMIGMRQQGWLHGRTQLRRQCDSALLKRGNHVQACVIRTVLSAVGHVRQPLRLCFCTACVSVQEVGNGVNPTAQQDSRRNVLVAQMQDGEHP